MKPIKIYANNQKVGTAYIRRKHSTSRKLFYWRYNPADGSKRINLGWLEADDVRKKGLRDVWHHRRI